MNEREAMLFSAGIDTGVALACRIMRDSVSAQIEKAKEEMMARVKMNINGMGKKIEALLEEDKNG